MSSYRTSILIFPLVKATLLSSYKSIILIFAVVRTTFLSLYKIVESEESPDNCKPLKIGIGAIIENPGMLKFLSDQFRTNNTLAFVTMYFPLRCKTQEMCYFRKKWNIKVYFFYKNQKICNKAIDNYSHALEFILNYYKTQQMCNKAIDNYTHALEIVPDCFKTQNICNKAIDNYSHSLAFVPNYYKT